MLFSELNLKAEIVTALSEKGFTEPTEIQARCIPPIMEGKDIVGRSQTGSGKTFAFGLPAINRIDMSKEGVQALALCPTRELAMQVAEEIQKAVTHLPGCNVAAVYGGAGMESQIKALKTAKIVVATPGRLMDHMKRRNLNPSTITYVVLDECDEMLDMGFRDDIEKILERVTSERQTVMFSATMPGPIRALAKTYMKELEFIELCAPNSTLTEIQQTYIKTEFGRKLPALIQLFKNYPVRSAVVFCNTKRMTEEVCIQLKKNDIHALMLNGDMQQSARKKVMDDIKSHKANLLVATDVAARGIDIDDINYVVNFDLPGDVEYYIHRIGRTGRAGKSGNAVTIIDSREDMIMLNYYMKESNSNIAEHALSRNDLYVIKPAVPFANRGERMFRRRH